MFVDEQMDEGISEVSVLDMLEFDQLARYSRRTGALYWPQQAAGSGVASQWEVTTSVIVLAPSQSTIMITQISKR